MFDQPQHVTKHATAHVDACAKTRLLYHCSQPFRQDFGLVLRDHDGVLEVGGQRSVRA